MAQLVYTALTSLDGFTTDAAGNIDWAAPDPEVLGFINDLESRFGTYLYGRRMYEAMLYWETFDATDEPEANVRAFAHLWRAASKIVYSRTLAGTSSAHTRVERIFDPQVVRRMKETTGHDLSVGGPELAGQALAAGLVDEIHLFLTPITLGGGKPVLPARWRSNLALVEVDRFDSGVIHVQYAVRD
jgi:dihydrofolate reductase